MYQENCERISGSGFEGLRWLGSRTAPLHWRRRELALDTSQAYHPCVVCATAIISQSSSLLPRRPTARAIHRQTDAHIETEKEAETQTDQETEAAGMLVRCALSVCACASRVKGRRASPSEQGPRIVESYRLRRRSDFHQSAINFVRRS